MGTRMQDSLLDPASLPFGFFAAFFGVYGMAAAFGTAVACGSPHFLSTSILAGTRALQTDAVSMLVVPPHSFSQHIALPCVCHARDCSRAPSSTLCWWDWPALRTSPLLGSWMRPSASQLRSLLAFGYAAGQTVRIQKGRIGEE